MLKPSAHVGPFSYQAAASEFSARHDLLSFIKEVRRRRNGLCREDIFGIAEAWGTTASEVYGIATFYSFLGAGPRGLNLVKVCRSTPCCLKGCGVIAAETEKVLSISEGETTPDGLFSLTAVNCIGQCDNPPSLMVNDDVYQGVAVTQVRGILDRYRHHKGETAGSVGNSNA